MPGILTMPARPTEEPDRGPLFACSDVMPGRGIDEVLPHPGDPKLREDYFRGQRRGAVTKCRSMGLSWRF